MFCYCFRPVTLPSVLTCIQEMLSGIFYPNYPPIINSFIKVKAEYHYNRRHRLHHHDIAMAWRQQTINIWISVEMNNFRMEVNWWMTSGWMGNNCLPSTHEANLTAQLKKGGSIYVVSRFYISEPNIFRIWLKSVSFILFMFLVTTSLQFLFQFSLRWTYVSKWGCYHMSFVVQIAQRFNVQKWS